MKLYDYECDTCGRKFEAMGEEAKCPSKACEGNGQRQLGGRPLRTTVTQGGYECQIRPDFSQRQHLGHIHLPSGAVMNVDAVPYDHVHVPKAKA